MSFFNTINLVGHELKSEISNCTKQEQMVLMIMSKGKAMTPFEVLKYYRYGYKDVPITSIRRAMTCLTDKGLLIKSDEMKKEMYGKPNHCWIKK